MFNRANLLIVLLALASAGTGLLLSLWLRPPTALPTAAGGLRPLAVGDLAEDARLPDAEGKPRRLGEWSGRLVLLNFWASWCAPCREEMPLLAQARARHLGQGLEVIGIAAENGDDARAFLAAHPVDYPILIDAPGDGPDLSLRLGNVQSVLPYTVLIGRDGRILARKIGNFSERSLEQWLAPHL